MRDSQSLSLSWLVEAYFVESVSGWTFLWRCIDRAALETKQFWGWDVKTTLTSLALLILGIIIQWRVRGVSETKDDFAKWIITIAIPFVVFASGLLLFNLARAPFLLLSDIVKADNARVAEATKGRENAEAERDRARAASVLLTKQLSERAKSVRTAQQPSPSSPDEQRQKQRKEIRIQIAKFLVEGKNILGAIEQPNSEQAKLQAVADDWNTRTIKYLTANIGEDYAIRFESGAGLPPISSGASLTADKNLLWRGIYNRLSRLEQFLQELKD